MPTGGGRGRPGSVPHEDAVRRLRDLLRSAVLRGTYLDGLLPSEQDLMSQHRATRGVVRDALNLLRAEGLVARTQGVGTFSVSRATLSELAEAHGHGEVGPARPPVSTRPRILDRSVISTPDLVGSRLASSDERCLRLEYVLISDEEPMAMATNYVLFPEAEAVRTTEFVSDWYRLLADAGAALGESEFTMGCATADATNAPVLGLPVGHPVMTIEQVIRDDDGRPYDLAFIVLRGDRFLFLSRAGNLGAADERSPSPQGPATRRSQQ